MTKEEIKKLARYVKILGEHYNLPYAVVHEIPEWCNINLLDNKEII